MDSNLHLSPASPQDMDWSPYYPDFVTKESPNDDDSLPKKLRQDVEIVDIGCGFGGLLMALAPLLPDKLMLGMYPSIYIFICCAHLTNLQVWKSAPV